MARKAANKDHQSTFDFGSEPVVTEMPASESSDLPSEPRISEDIQNESDFDPANLKGKRVFVLDSHSLVYQVFHAIGGMTGPDGQAVNAIYGFTRDMLDIFEKWKPDLLFAVFDYSDTTFRNHIFSDYKAHRDPMPDDLRGQIPEIQKILNALAVPVLVKEGYEADDILATLAREVEQRGGDCILVTSDKDCRQLITDHVSLLNLRKGQYYKADELQKDWGIRPDQVVDFQAMVGDSVDNVPGIPSIGPKTATQLIQQFETLEQLLERWSEVKGKKGEKIRDSREQALMSKQLVKLDADVPIDIPWLDGKIGKMDVAEAVRLCEEKGFRSLTDRVAKLAPQQKIAKWTATYRTLTDAAELEKILKEASNNKLLSFDTETTSPLPRWADIVGASLAWKTGQAAYIPVRAPIGEKTMDVDTLVEILKPILEDPEWKLIGQNLKYDMVVMRALGVSIRCQQFDTMVADYLINPGRPVHNMDDMAIRYLRHKTIKISELIGKGKDQIRMDEVPVAKVTDYAAEDS
ncbi:MAG: 5'-3' exonuclease H3TH domain-containing protein [Pirellulaceae bacterium]